MRDVFAALALPVSTMTVHNSYLLSVECGDDGYERFIVEVNGSKGSVVSASRFGDSSKTRVGVWGYLQTIDNFYGPELPTGATKFIAYCDQSLRRYPELDQGGQLGWACASSPMGFLCPANIIPGENGRFIRDETEEITLRIPPEFVMVAKLVQQNPEDLLCSFIGDIAGIQNYMSNPRADGYTSNGSDERDLAHDWLHRTYDIDPEAIDALVEQEKEEAALEDALHECSIVLADLISSGGDHQELLDVLRQFAASKQTE